MPPRRNDRGGIDVLLGLRQIGKEDLIDPDERRVGCGIVWGLDEKGSMVVRGVVPRGPASQVRDPTSLTRVAQNGTQFTASPACSQATPTILMGDLLLSIDGEEVPEDCRPVVSVIAQKLLGKEDSIVTLGLCRPVSVPILPSELAMLTEGSADYFLGMLGNVTCATFHVEIHRFPVQRNDVDEWAREEGTHVVDRSKRFMF
eukprot:CAMPEP_0202817410 /NCGR_PEP_ID=MMETSP1389-20130828/7629_1 /ASSEMBLY_ACC=CAM_ASM_000865 /TAXON_ID=302021 /ORGANISM="Rhodomonas sp., Strain CCMP768" /LENGTH=201 /DNA_ID=CAMNT_0049489623 /DNA_START=133 /DNA_END=739 /DNA_ORIENTATION=-